MYTIVTYLNRTQVEGINQPLLTELEEDYMIDGFVGVDNVGKVVHYPHFKNRDVLNDRVVMQVEISSRFEKVS